MEISKELQQDFAFALFQRYHRHCDKEDQDMCFQHFTEFLVECGIVKERTVQRFMVNELYPQALASCGGKKMEAITLISEETGLSERTINNILTRPELYALK